MGGTLRGDPARGVRARHHSGGGCVPRHPDTRRNPAGREARGEWTQTWGKGPLPTSPPSVQFMSREWPISIRPRRGVEAVGSSTSAQGKPWHKVRSGGGGHPGSAVRAGEREGSAARGSRPSRSRAPQRTNQAPDGRAIGITELLRRAGLEYVDAESHQLAPGLPPDAVSRASKGLVTLVGPEFPDFVMLSYIAHFAEVRVDPRIPRARVSRMVSVVD